MKQISRVALCCSMALGMVATNLYAAPPVQKKAKSRKISTSKLNWDSVKEYKVPQWFADAKFGIYAHYGPVTLGAYGSDDHWYGSRLYSPDQKGGKANKYHKETFGDPKDVGYKDVIKKFNPSAFDAEELAKLYKATGAKFAGPVAIHHDNFAMWDSKVTRWNSVNYGGIDISGELKKHLKEQGLKFMMSSHLAFSWTYYANAHKFDGKDSQYEDLYHRPHGGTMEGHSSSNLINNPPDAKFNQMWLAKMKEMIDLYGPDLMWFDFGPEALDEVVQKEYFDYYFANAKKNNREVVVTYKHGAKDSVPANVAVLDYERR